MRIDFSNVENLIFYDRDIQNKLSQDMFSIFEQWRLSKQFSYLRELGKQSLLDFLNQIDDSQIEILTDHFGEAVFVEKLSYDIVKNLKIPVENKKICNKLCDLVGFSNLISWRDKDYIYISFWR